MNFGGNKTIFFYIQKLEVFIGVFYYNAHILLSVEVKIRLGWNSNDTTKKVYCFRFARFAFGRIKKIGSSQSLSAAV
jgi:hypothetical protein